MILEWYDAAKLRRYLRELDRLGIGYDIAHVVRFGAVLGQTITVEDPTSVYDEALVMHEQLTGDIM